MPSQTIDAIVLGAGFVGLGAAMALQERGRSVVLVDRLGAAAGETSFGNTGIVQSEAVFPTRFRAIPPRSPSPPSTAIRARISATRRCRRSRRRSGATGGPRGAGSREPRAPWRRGGVPRPPQDRGGGGRGRASARRRLDQGVPHGGGRARGLADAEEARPFGVHFATLDRAALLALEPSLGEAAIGGVHFTDPLTTPDPAALGAAYLALFLSRGGELVRADARRWSLGRNLARDGPSAGLFRPARRWWRSARGRTRWRASSATNCRSSSSAAITCTMPRATARRLAPAGARSREGLCRHTHGAGASPDHGGGIRRPDDPPSPAHLERLEPFAREIYPLGPAS